MNALRNIRIERLDSRVHLAAIDGLFTDPRGEDLLARQYIPRKDDPEPDFAQVSVSAPGQAVGSMPSPVSQPGGDIFRSTAWSSAEPASNVDDEMVMPVLTPGTGFEGPVEDNLPAIGDPSAAGYDAKAIARWDVVPYQTFDGKFNVGVVAFHMNGIEKVSFSVNNGPWEDVYKMTLNTQTANHSGIGNESDGVVEYWATLDASLFQADGAVEVRAIAYPGTGIARAMEAITLFSNGRGTLASPTFYVKPSSGSDTNIGSRDQPFASLQRALYRAPEGSTIVLVEEGRYQPDRSGQELVRNARWITVTSDAGLNRDRVIIGASAMGATKPGVFRLRWDNVSIDISKVGQYTNVGNSAWFSRVNWYSELGRSANVGGVHYQTTYFMTDSAMHDCFLGPMYATIVRNVSIDRICGDALSMTKMTINVALNDFKNMDNWAYHSDIWQYWWDQDNIVHYGFTGRKIEYVQGFLMNQPNQPNTVTGVSWNMRNVAFVNIDIDYDGPWPPYSQMQGPQNHVLFTNFAIQQPIWMRTDMTDANKFVPRNVVFKDCRLDAATYNNYVIGHLAPVGVQFVNCLSF
jgi:hypothetical protein